MAAYSAVSQSEMGTDQLGTQDDLFNFLRNDYKTLRSAAAGTGTYIGSAINTWHLNDGQYTSIAAREFNIVTAEASCKMEIIVKGWNNFDYQGCDGVKNFAQSHDMKMRGHTLIWAKNGSWIPNLIRWETNPSKIEGFMKNYIQ